MTKMKTISHHTALIYVMVIISASDGSMSEKELKVIGELSKALPSFDGFDHGRLHHVRGLIEKPDPDHAPSDLAIIGRYVLTPKIFDKLEQTQRGAGGEIQLTDAIEALMQEQEVYAYAFEGTRYDAGTTMGWLKASVELALQRPDLSAEFRDYLRSVPL